MIQIQPRSRDKTVIVFSGMAPLNHVYEWTQSFAELPVNLIGVKDPDNKWYQTTFDNTLTHLHQAVVALQTKYLLCLGGSAGGFAALIFGQALGANQTIAFCPQSACGQTKRDLGDKRWLDMCQSTPPADIAGAYHGATVHYAADDVLDTMHAKRFVANLQEWPNGGHDLPFMLRNNGVLQSLLTEAVA